MSNSGLIGRRLDVIVFDDDIDVDYFVAFDDRAPEGLATTLRRRNGRRGEAVAHLFDQGEEVIGANLAAGDSATAADGLDKKLPFWYPAGALLLLRYTLCQFQKRVITAPRKPAGPNANAMARSWTKRTRHPWPRNAAADWPNNGKQPKLQPPNKKSPLVEWGGFLFPL